MSEYQYYEFVALDKPLSPAALAELRQLSKRATISSHRAVFTYSHGDFRGDPPALVLAHCDMMLYIANWGATELIIRLPKNSLNRAALTPYRDEFDQLEISEHEEHLLIRFAFYEEGGVTWLQGEDPIEALLPLREELLRGDLRALYLIWLQAAALQCGLLPTTPADDEWDEQSASIDPSYPDQLIEPPVPPGLQTLSEAQQALVDQFGLDLRLIEAASQTSSALLSFNEPFEQWIDLMPAAEQRAFLLRLAHGEPIQTQVRQRLRELGGTDAAASPIGPRRTFREIMQRY